MGNGDPAIKKQGKGNSPCLMQESRNRIWSTVFRIMAIALHTAFLVDFYSIFTSHFLCGFQGAFKFV